MNGPARIEYIGSVITLPMRVWIKNVASGRCLDVRSGPRRFAIRQELIDVQAVAEVGGHPSCRRMRLTDVALFLKPYHDVAKGS